MERDVGAALFDIGRQVGLLPFERAHGLRELRFGGLQTGDFALALGDELVAIQPRDDLPLLNGVAFIDIALDQAAGGLEGDVDFGELDVAGDDEAVIGRAMGAAEGVERGPGGGERGSG